MAIEKLNLHTDIHAGSVMVRGQGSIEDLAAALNHDLLSKVKGFPSRTFPGPRNKVKAFSFHWSNAQAAWDVITVKEPWSGDGAEFMLYTHPLAVSPLGKPWSLREMDYVATKLIPHPGFANAFR